MAKTPRTRPKAPRKRPPKAQGGRQETPEVTAALTRFVEALADIAAREDTSAERKAPE